MKSPKMVMGDSRGKESKTLFFVTVSWLAVLFKFVAGGITLPIVGLMPLMPADNFGIATGLILTIWLGREWTEKTNDVE